jgi:hypothetical protein
MTDDQHKASIAQQEAAERAKQDQEFREMLDRSMRLTPEEVYAQRFQEFLDDFQAGCL